jgi:hypothetical protein
MKPKRPTGYQRMRATQLAYATTELGREVVSDETSLLSTTTGRTRELKARRKASRLLSASR